MADEDDLSVSASMAEGTGGTANWQKYVNTFLPSERASEFTKEELAVEQAVIKVIGAETWNALPREIKINVMRGNAHEKERLKVTSQSAKSIAAWRAKYRIDAEALTMGPFPGSEIYFSSWPTRVAGTDDFGHPILYDRFSTMNIVKLLTLEEEPLYRYRTQALEALMFLKQELSARVGVRVSKHVYILDLAGLEPTRHFTSAAQKKLRPVMSMSAEMFPETLWSVWIINAPMTFRFIWNVVRTWLDPLIRAKIRMWGSTRSKWQTAMADCGIHLNALPAELGGTSPSQSLDDILMRAAVKHSKEAAAAAIAAPIVAQPAS
jgi:hypothetical protein